MSWLGWPSKSKFREYPKRQRQNLSKNERWDDFRSIQLRHHFGIQFWAEMAGLSWLSWAGCGGGGGRWGIGRIRFCLYCIAYWYCLLAPVIPLWENRALLFPCGRTGPVFGMVGRSCGLADAFLTRYDNNIYVYKLEVAILVERCWHSWKVSSDFSREVLKFMKISSHFSREVLKFMKISSQKHWVYDTS